MRWKDLLCEYEIDLAFINRQSEYCSKEHIIGMYRMLRSIIRHMRLYCEELPRIDYSTNTFFYRGHEYKVCFDDAGQQLYLDLGDITLSGGAFNDSPEWEWMELLDDIIDKEHCSWLAE